MKIKFMIDNFKGFLYYLNGLQLKLKINIIKTLHICGFQNLVYTLTCIPIEFNMLL